MAPAANHRIIHHTENHGTTCTHIENSSAVKTEGLKVPSFLTSSQQPSQWSTKYNNNSALNTSSNCPHQMPHLIDVARLFTQYGSLR